MTSVTLVHNPGAGEQTPTADDLMATLRDQGLEAAYVSTKDTRWEEALDDPGDLVVAAGGDGTMHKVAFALLGRDVPMLMLPLGTANNLASSLGIQGEPLELLKQVSRARPLPLDVGTAEGPRKRTRFLEGAGVGLFSQTILAADSGVIPEPADAERELRRDVRLAHATLTAMDPVPVTVIADGEDLSAEYLVVEAMNVRMIGPNVVLAPDADPTDGMLDLVLVGREDEPALEALLLGEEADRAYSVRRVKSVRIQSEVARFHLDDKVRPRNGQESPLSVRLAVERGAITVLLP